MTTRPETGLSKETRIFLTFITGVLVSGALYLATVPGIPVWLPPVLGLIGISASAAREFYGYTDSNRLK